MGNIKGIIGSFLGRGLIGFLLNYIFDPNNDNPDPENWFGSIGSFIGIIIAAYI